MCGLDEQLIVPLAHSADKKHNIPPQTYIDHIARVVSRAVDNANRVAPYASHDGPLLLEAVQAAAEYHDLGKLDPDNQVVLKGECDARHLPVQHTEAGTVHLLDDLRFAIGAALVRSHHIGLPDFVTEQNRSESEVLRDENAETRRRIDKTLEELLLLHNSVRQTAIVGSSRAIHGNAASFFRFALSCIVDADHYDTARHYRDTLPSEEVPLRPVERLRLLDAHIKYLSQTQQGNRTAQRKDVYLSCRNAEVSDGGMYACDSPVGTGKTTAVMAHLLKAATDKGLRRVFVVLPFTNIIDQSVDVYRRALVGLGEDECNIVAAHHHRAEFESLELRQYSFLWHAPIVVTTAVQFFETLASNRPASLRKLHQLPGSAIFIDEAHAALPADLWPQAWKWLKDLRDNWGCYFVFGSGSLNRFWRLEEFEEPPIELPELVAEDIRGDTMAYEDNRITYPSKPKPLSLDKLLDWMEEVPGPRLLIVNTVQSAAVIADKLRDKWGRTCIEHLSTSLTPSDRTKTLHKVEQRLADSTDVDWTLVATSCVEAGIDLSFRTGLRERCSLNSLIQIGGRVNRKGDYQNAKVWDFRLQYDDLLVTNPAFETSASVLSELFSAGQVGPELATEAMRREIRQAGMRQISVTIQNSERDMRFPDVAERFKIIDTNTVTVIVNGELLERIRRREKISSIEIQNGSVQIWTSKELKYGLQPIDGFPELRQWNLLYDDFLGYMAGVLPVLRQNKSGCSFA